jgi:SAM-dependent methyltransferase
MKKWLPEELEEIPCDVCGSTEVCREFMRADGMRVVECATCGLAYMTPRPKPEFIPKFYEADYFTGAAAERGEGGLRCDINPSPAFTEAPGDIPRPIAIINEKFGGLKGKKVLEIGCATGDLLVKMQKAGAIVKGLEISDFAACVARNRGLNVTTGTIEDFERDKRGTFDIVMAFEVVEHVLGPRCFLKCASELVRPGGLLLMSTPNYSCAKRFGNEWLGFNASFEHIYFFSLKQLLGMVGPLGFTCEYVESSLSLGGPGARRFLRRQIERMKNMLFFLSEIGLRGTVKAIAGRKKKIYLFAVGHTLYAAFRKRKPESSTGEGA